MNKLFRFKCVCGRCGTLEGIFVATQEEVDELDGEQVYFGEVLGKHSDVNVVLEASDFEVLTDDQEFIEKAIKFGIADVGYNPLEYLAYQEDEED